MSTRCARGVHGCPGASEGTLSGCCGSLRHDLGHGEVPKIEMRYMRTRLDEISDAISMHCYAAKKSITGVLLSFQIL